MTRLRYILLAAALCLMAAYAAHAVSLGTCIPYTTCINASAGHNVTEASGSSNSADDIPTTVVETNSNSIFNVFFMDPDGTDDDTDDEVAATLGMTCVDVIEFAEAGGSGDEMIAATCTTDLTSKFGLLFVK